jgi:hypothetical protein
MRSSNATQTDSRARIIVLHLALFCAPIFLAWALLERWTAIAVPNSYGVRRQKFEAQAKQVDTLVIGSSRAYRGIAPRQLSGFAFNLAGTSQSLYYDYHLMMRVLPKVQNLRRVMIEIQDLSLFYQMHDGSEAWRQYYYQQEWGIPPPKLTDRLDIRMFSRVALRTPQFYRDALPTAIRSFSRGAEFVPDPSLTDIDDRGWWNPHYDTPDLSPAAEAATFDRHSRLMRGAYETTNLGYLKRMLSTLRERGVEAVLVTLPVTGTYSNWMDKDYWSRTQADIQRLRAEYGVRYLCFLTVPELGQQDFSDIDHLSPAGAVRFTAFLRLALEHSPAAEESSCACCSP